jgi:hypothetical protein
VNNSFLVIVFTFFLFLGYIYILLLEHPSGLFLVHTSGMLIHVLPDCFTTIVRFTLSYNCSGMLEASCAAAMGKLTEQKTNKEVVIKQEKLDTA